VADVTVVIPSRNRPHLVQRSISSALAQKGVSTTVVVVDDGSDDEAARLMSRAAGPSVQVVRHTASRGVSAARNSGLARVRTAWVAFLDDDDYWAPEKIRHQLDALHRTPRAGWSCVGAVHVDAGSRPLYWRRPPDAEEALYVLSRDGGIPGGGSGVLVSTQLAREVGGFDPTLSILADWDFYFRLARRSRVATVDRPLVGYFTHSDSMYHDPVGVARELRALERKYRGSLPELRPDQSAWALKLTIMALRARDNRALWQLVSDGIPRRIRPRSLVRFLTDRFIGTRVGSRTRPQDWNDEPLTWLDQSIPGPRGRS
jgi:glycosyltransferase involved in cell wall biosynthesis